MPEYHKGHTGYWLGKKKPHTEAEKKHISEGLKGHILTKETKLKIGKSLKGRDVWNKGISWSNEVKQKISETNKQKGIEPRIKFSAKAEKNPSWKGDNVGYIALHNWVKRRIGKAKQCINGHIAKSYCWANISGEYKRDLSDWHELCQHCNKTDGIKIHERFIPI